MDSEDIQLKTRFWCSCGPCLGVARHEGMRCSLCLIFNCGIECQRTVHEIANHINLDNIDN